MVRRTPPAPRPAARSKCRSDRRSDRRALPARGRSGGCRGRRSGRPCPRSTGNSAGRGRRSRRNRRRCDGRWRARSRGRRALVRVMWQRTCGVAIASVSAENGSGGSSPGWTSSARPVDRRPVEPRRRAGLEPAEREAGRLERSAPGRPTARRRPGRPACAVRRDGSRPCRKVPVVTTSAAQASVRPSASSTAADRAVGDDEVGSPRPRSTVRLSVSTISALHRQAIELAVGLGARALHRRALAAVEDAELDAGGVGGAAHQPVERVDLAHQMALAEPADRRIAATSRRSCRSAG